jgi:hypothetical protein
MQSVKINIQNTDRTIHNLERIRHTFYCTNQNDAEIQDLGEGRIC